MGRSTMNGEMTSSGATLESVATMMPNALQRRRLASSPRRVVAAASRAAGFTLLELMIVISIIVILATVALPQYQKATRHAKETVLRDDLFQMRKLIDQYAADKGKLPQSLDELVTEGYMREIPEDPITGERNWTLETGDDPASLEGGTGVINVRSASPDSPPDGDSVPYNQW
jgi:general secretion pathway protein G